MFAAFEAPSELAGLPIRDFSVCHSLRQLLQLVLVHFAVPLWRLTNATLRILTFDFHNCAEARMLAGASCSDSSRWLAPWFFGEIGGGLTGTLPHTQRPLVDPS